MSRWSDNGLLLTALTVSLAFTGCRGPQGWLDDHEDALTLGDSATAEVKLRDGLERHPDDVELLLAGAGFYLRPDEPDSWKPRLALHYAMRADRAASGQDERATAAMVRAHRASGGFAETEALVRQGLSDLNHPAADAPVLLKPVDPDLIDPTVENVLEQRRRDGMPPPTCPPGLVVVPEGRYPLDDGSDTEVAMFCVEERGRPVAASCETRALRDCSEAEAAVVAGPMSAMLQGESSHHRCCALATVGPVD